MCEKAKAAGKLAAILVIENSDGVERSLNILKSLHHLGVRSIGLTHDPTSWAAAGNAETDSGGGLTRFGVQLVKEMNRLGMLVDVSHISEHGFWNVLEIAERPVIASHSNCKALCGHPRNLTDEQIKRIAQNGGVIGATFVTWFIDDDAPSFSRYIDHIDHIVNLVGDDHVGIGSDFDGGGEQLRDATEFPKITEALLERGYSPEIDPKNPWRKSSARVRRGVSRIGIASLQLPTQQQTIRHRLTLAINCTGRHIMNNHRPTPTM